MILIPKPVDVSINDQPGEQSRESLFKSALTNKGFGLLDVHFFESRGQKKQWEIQSEFAELHRKENYAFLRGVNADFYVQNTGNVFSTRSDFGRSWIEKGLVELEGRVDIRSSDGYLFEMDHLNYRSRSHSFDSDDLVQMRGPDIDRPAMRLSGVGLNAEIDRETFHLRKNVRAKRLLSNNQSLDIQSKKGEFLTGLQTAIFLGDAQARLKDLTIYADRLELSIKQQEESILATGTVGLQSRSRKGRANSAVIALGTDRIVLSGNAEVESQGNMLRGDEISLYIDDDRIEVQGARGRIAP